MNQAERLNGIRPADLPAPPQSALAIVRACSGDDIDSSKLAKMAQADPVLVTEILRIVNSPLFGSKNIESIQHAINLLGTRALRNIVLCLMVRDALDSGVLKQLDLTSYWEDSIRHAVIARRFAHLTGCDVDESFTAGLLQDFGLLILFYLFPERIKSYENFQKLNPDERLVVENETFDMTHDQVIYVLMTQWSLPESLVESIVKHHIVDTDNEVPELSRLLNCVDWFSAVFSAQDKKNVIETAYSKAEQMFNLDRDSCQECLAEVPELVEKTAEALGLRISKQDNFEEVIKLANASLARENRSYQELTWELENAIAERDRLAEELNNEIIIAKEVQKKFMPAAGENDSIAGINIPARDLSGDFFDYVELASGKTMFILGDVSGKGVHAAILMTKTASLFHCLAKHIPDVARLLSILNKEVCETATRGYFVTLVCGILDPVNHHISLINAGHMPALFIGNDKQMRKVAAQTTPLGIDPGSDFGKPVDIAVGSGTLYLYSDGVTEASDEDGNMLEEHGFVEIINSADKTTLGEHVKQITDKVSGLKNKPDDITLMAIKV